MSNNNTRIRLKIRDIEISIEGNPEFVARQYQEMIGRLENKKKLPGDSGQKEKSKPVKTSTKSQKSSKTTKPTHSTKPASPTNLLNTLGFDFGKWLASLPNSSETRDKILLAAYFKQTTNSNKKFYMHGIRAILKEYGISVSNISNFLDTFEIQKIISKVSNSTRKGYKFTKDGEKYIRDLLGVKEK